jgi:hypothetical protein
MVMNRRLRVSEAVPVADHTASLVEAMVGVGSRWRLDVVRALLMGLAAVEMVTGVLTLLAVGRGAPLTHETRELGGFGVALGVGLLLAAIRPVRVAGVFPIVVALAATSLFGAGVDVAEGRTLLAGELHHLVEVVAVLVLWRLTRPARGSSLKGRLAPSS